MLRAWGAALVLSLAADGSAQSLGEVAKKEKVRREENAQNGASAREYQSSGGPIEQDVVREEETPEPLAASALDAEREKAKELEPRFAEIAREADKLDALFERWKNECHGRYTVTPRPGTATAVDPTASYDVRFGRSWLIVLENPNALEVATPGPGGKTVSTAETPQCQKQRREVVASAMWVKESLEEVLERARKKGILPGMVRELRRKYRLDWGRYRI
jgi:hypothetical protein